MRDGISVFPYTPATPPAGPEPWNGTPVPGQRPSRPVITVNHVSPDATGDVTVYGVAPTGGTANQVLAKASGQPYDFKWVDMTGGGGTWGSITGTLSAQTDLWTALTSKASASDLSSHTGNTSNPHSVTKSQVGLGNVDNTSDMNKPVSSAVSSALGLKQDTSNLVTAFQNTPDNTHYPSEKLVKDTVDARVPATGTTGYVLTRTASGTAWQPTAEPAGYLKDASVSGDVLTVTKKDNTTVAFDKGDKRDKKDLRVYREQYSSFYKNGVEFAFYLDTSDYVLWKASGAEHCLTQYKNSSLWEYEEDGIVYYASDPSFETALSITLRMGGPGSLSKTFTRQSVKETAEIVGSSITVDGYVCPSGGIPSSDMANAVQTSLGKADTSVQKSGDTMTDTLTIANGGDSYNSSVVLGSATQLPGRRRISPYGIDMWNSTSESWDQLVSFLPGNAMEIVPMSALASKQDSLSYSSTRAYSVGQACIYNNALYVCNTQIAAAGEAWTAAHWTKVCDLYKKPSGGIPSSDMTSAVRTSLGKADTALQSHQDISGKANKTDLPYGYKALSHESGYFVAEDGKILLLQGLVAGTSYTVVSPVPDSGKVTDFCLRVTQPAGTAASITVKPTPGVSFVLMETSGDTMEAGKDYIMAFQVFPSATAGTYELMATVRELSNEGEVPSYSPFYMEDGKPVVDEEDVGTDGTVAFFTQTVNADGSVTSEVE